VADRCITEKADAPGRVTGTDDRPDDRKEKPPVEGLLLPVLLFAALGVMMYMSVKKQKRMAAQTQEMHNALRPGTRVMTSSGLHGTVTAIADDTIELEISPGVRTTWVKAAVREVVVPAADAISEPAIVESVEPLPPFGESDGRPNLRKDS
jgi:preprotein translocase subunit YajC